MSLQNLAKYHVWSCKKYRELLISVSDDDYNKEFNGRTIGGITGHILAALLTCFHVIEKDDEKYWEWLDDAPKEKVIERWEQADLRFLKLVLALPKEPVTVSHMSENPFTIDSNEFVTQYIIHTVHHRGQLALILRDIGYEVPQSDYLHFFGEKA